VQGRSWPFTPIAGTVPGQSQAGLRKWHAASGRRSSKIGPTDSG
jgi:hypothetical protein